MTHSFTGTSPCNQQQQDPPGLGWFASGVERETVDTHAMVTFKVYTQNRKFSTTLRHDTSVFTIAPFFGQARITVFVGMLEESPMTGREVQEEREEGLICRVVQIEHYLADEFEVPEDDSVTFCEPLVDDFGLSDGKLYSIDLPTHLEDHSYRIPLQQMYVRIPGGTLNGNSVDIPNPSEMRIFEPPVSYIETPLSIGTQRVTLIRVSLTDSRPSLSSRELSDLLFEDQISMHSQFSKCSIGKLNLQPAAVGGVLEVFLKLTTASKLDAVVNAALDEVVKQLPSGTSSIFDVADLVMVMLPPNIANFAAYAVVNGHLATLGPRHGFFNDKEYRDQTGNMGGVFPKEGRRAPETTHYPRSCFNGQNNWHMGWFGDAALEARPTVPKIYKIFAFVDFDKRTDGFAVIKVHNYFLQFNRALSFNVDTGLGADTLTIVATRSEGRRGTELVATLRRSDAAFTLPGSSTVIDICFESFARFYNAPDHMMVSIGNGRSLCPTPSPTRRPTRAPTRRPTVSPTRRPTQAPTRRPTIAPTLSPTSLPTPSPTFMPNEQPSAPPSATPTLAPAAALTLQPLATAGNPTTIQEAIPPATVDTMTSSFNASGNDVPTAVEQAFSASARSREMSRSSKTGLAFGILLTLTLGVFLSFRRRCRRRVIYKFDDADDLRLGRIVGKTKQSKGRKGLSDESVSSDSLNSTVPDEASYYSGPMGIYNEVPPPRAPRKVERKRQGFLDTFLWTIGLREDPASGHDQASALSLSSLNGEATPSGRGTTYGEDDLLSVPSRLFSSRQPQVSLSRPINHSGFRTPDDEDDIVSNVARHHRTFKIDKDGFPID